MEIYILFIIVNLLSLNLSLNSPTDWFTNSSKFILSKFNLIFPEDALDASIKSSIIITLFICIILINRNIALKKIEKHLKGVCKGNLSDKLEIKDFKFNLCDLLSKILIYFFIFSSFIFSFLSKSI